jgi:hypothetical protein
MQKNLRQKLKLSRQKKRSVSNERTEMSDKIQTNKSIAPLLERLWERLDIEGILWRVGIAVVIAAMTAWALLGIWNVPS